MSSFLLNCPICKLCFSNYEDRVPVICTSCHESMFCQKCFTKDKMCPNCHEVNAKCTVNRMIISMLPQSCSSCHNAINNQEELLECCNQKFCVQCYVTHTLNEVNLSFDTINPVMREIHKYHHEINGLIALEAKIIKEYNNWYISMQTACNVRNVDIKMIKQCKVTSQEYQDAWIYNCMLPLKQSVNYLSQILNSMKILENSVAMTTIAPLSLQKQNTERKVVKKQNITKEIVKFNYPQQVENDKRELKLEGRNVVEKRYLSVTEDNCSILISGWSRDVLSCDVTGENCVSIIESLESEGAVTCVKCYEGNNFVIGTGKGYLIKFVLVGTGSYQRKQISQLACPDGDQCVRGLCADSRQFSTWWCVTEEVCYKVGTHSWEVKYKRNEESKDFYDIRDIVIKDELIYLLFYDKVKVLNIVDDKLQFPSRIIPVGGRQLQIVNEDLIIAGGKIGLFVVNIESGVVLHKWQMSGYDVAGVDVDINNKVIYVLTWSTPSCLFCIKC